MLQIVRTAFVSVFRDEITGPARKKLSRYEFFKIETGKVGPYLSLLSPFGWIGVLQS